MPRVTRTSQVRPNLLEPLPRLAWMADSACAGVADPEIFTSDNPHDQRAAKAVCEICPVAAECLDYGMSNVVLGGVLGGMTEMERGRRRTGYIADRSA